MFTDGSFVYVPKGVRCPMELSTYFRINAADTGQFERTLIVADEGAYVSYLEGCTAPKRDDEPAARGGRRAGRARGRDDQVLDRAELVCRRQEGKGGIYNFVTKRGKCAGENSKISWTQVETGSAITWKYPSVILQGDNSVGEFYSVAVVNNQPAGRHRHEDDPHRQATPKSTIVSKGISAGQGNNSYRGQVQGAAEGGRRAQLHAVRLDARSATAAARTRSRTSRCRTTPRSSSTRRRRRRSARTRSSICKQRGLSAEQAVSMIVSGFCKEVFKELPMEFALEAQQLLGITLEGRVG